MNRPTATLDIECFSNWFLVGVTDHATGNRWDVDAIAGGAPLDLLKLEALLRHFTIITFNGANYDLPMLTLAMAGATVEQLKAGNELIIKRQMKWWDFYRHFGIRQPNYIDHIDISEPVPGVRLSLKQYACRAHAPLVQDTPVDFEAPLPLHHVADETSYCQNDREVTNLVFEGVAERMKLRYHLSEQYGVDLRSKSDAQIAEAVIKAEWERRMAESIGKWDDNSTWEPGIEGDYPHLEDHLEWDTDYNGKPKVRKRVINHGYTFQYAPPDYIEFVTPQMQQFLQVVRDCVFVVNDKEEAELMGIDEKSIKTGVQIPKELKGRDIRIGTTVYRVGIGGLHSQESNVSYKSIIGVQTLRTADVASYYPSMILNMAMNPKQMGKLFSTIYRHIYVTRLAAKKDGRKVEAEGLKIVLNGTFGKLFSKHSIFFAPEFGIATTLTGQLCLLMLIERLEYTGIKVVSANTDGIEMLVPFGWDGVVDDIIRWWEKRTALVMEQSNYAALYSRDVNNYISVGFDGKAKRKGVYRPSGLMDNKHPDKDICAEAVVQFLTRGAHIPSTIMACRDIRQFLVVRGAKGGVVYGDEYLGRAARWYYSTRRGLPLMADAKSGNKVAGSDNAVPLMRLDGTFPNDVDLQYYVDVAESMLEDLGLGLQQ